MQQQISKNWFSMAVFMMLTVLAASAQAEEKMRVRLTGVSATSTTGGDFGSSFGLGLGVEYRPTNRIGIDLTWVDVDVESELSLEFGPFRSSVTSTTEMQPILFGVHFYPLRSERFDLFLGPVAGYAKLGDIETSVSVGLEDGGEVEIARLPVEDEFVLGARLGFDLQLGSRTFLTASGTFLHVPLEVADGEEIESGDLETVMLQVGLGFRF